jgi:RNA polymerase sigma factor (sigma-70 family)
VRGWLRASLRIENEDDVIQEAYAKMFAHGGFEHIVSGRAWFFAVARNIVLKQMRRDRIVRIDAVAEIDALGIVDYEPSAERALSGRQELARVQRLIEALPERCRLIFLMRKIDGLPQREIAARLRVSENIVEKEAARGLRLVLQGLGSEAGGARRPLRLFGRKGGRDAKADRR